MRPQSVVEPICPEARNFVSASARAFAYAAWNSFSGVARSASRRAQKIFWNSSRSPFSLRPL